MLIITFGALEQTGQNWGQLLDYWLKLKPQKIINIEPVYELYDQSLLIEYLGSFYHKERNYLTGYLPRLKELQKHNKISFLKYQSIPISGINSKGWNLIEYNPNK